VAPAITENSKILIVEDEYVVAMDLEYALINLGYTVVGTAARGVEALRLAEATTPDLVLMDIHLPGSKDGIEAAEEIRRRWKIPVVFVTAYMNEDTVNRAKKVHPFGYLTKPCGPSALGAAVEVALHQHKAEAEVFSEHTWLTRMLSAFSDGVIATNTHGSVTYMNEAATKVTGWSAAEAIGRCVSEVYPLRTLDGKPLTECRPRTALRTSSTLHRERFLLTTKE